MSGSDITLELAQEALKDDIEKSVISKNKIDQVQQLVANNYNISVEDIRGKKRKAEINLPRQIAMYICRVVLGESLTKIGIEFGGKDHTTVMHSVDKIKKQLKSNKELQIEIAKIIEKMFCNTYGVIAYPKKGIVHFDVRAKKYRAINNGTEKRSVEQE